MQEDTVEEAKSLGKNGNMSAKPETAVKEDIEFKYLASVLGFRGRAITRKYIVNHAIKEIQFQVCNMEKLQKIYKQCYEELEANQEKLLSLNQGLTDMKHSPGKSKIFLNSDTTCGHVSKPYQKSEMVFITDSPKNCNVSASECSSPCEYVRDKVPSSAPLVAASASQPIELICLDDDSDDDRISSTSSRPDSVISGKCEVKVNPNCVVGTVDVFTSTSDCSREKLAVSDSILTGCSWENPTGSSDVITNSSRDMPAVMSSISTNCFRDKPAVAGSLTTCKLIDSVPIELLSQRVIFANTIKLKPRLVAPSRSGPSSLEYLCQLQLQKDPSYLVINTLGNKIIKIGHGLKEWRNPEFSSTPTQMSATFSNCNSATQAKIVCDTVKVVDAHLSKTASYALPTQGGSIVTAIEPGIDNFKLLPSTSNLFRPQKENKMSMNYSQYAMGSTPSVSHIQERNIISVTKPEVAYVKVQPSTSGLVGPHTKSALVLQKARLPKRETHNLPQNPTSTVIVNLPKVDFIDSQSSTLSSLTTLRDKRFNNKSRKCSNVASSVPEAPGKITVKINDPEVDFRKSKPSTSCITMSHSKDTYMSKNKLGVLSPRVAAPNVPHISEKILVISASNAVHNKSQQSELCSDSKEKANYLLCSKASPAVTDTSGNNIMRVISTHYVDSMKEHSATTSINNISKKMIDALPHSETPTVPDISGRIVIVNMSDSDVVETQPTASQFTIPYNEVPRTVSSAVHNRPSSHKAATIIKQTSHGRVNSRTNSKTTIDVQPAMWEKIVKVDEPITINLQPKYTCFTVPDSVPVNITAIPSSSQATKNVMQITGQKIEMLNKPVVVHILPKTSALPVQTPRNRVGFCVPQNSGGKVVTVREPLVHMQASTSGFGHSLSFKKLPLPNEPAQSPTQKAVSYNLLRIVTCAL